MDLKKYIRDIPDFPEKGIIFKDITPLLKSPKAFKYVIDAFTEYFENKDINTVVGIESRGFIFAGALAYKNNWEFVPVRKPGKLPYKTIGEEYTLEYGTNKLEIHEDAIDRSSKVLIIDDVLATGGTLRATANLVKKLGGEIKGIGVLIELEFLNGRKNLKEFNLYSLIRY